MKGDDSNVYKSSGHVTKSSFVFLNVYGDENGIPGSSAVSETYKAVDLRRSVALNYTEERGQGSINCLHGSNGYYDARVDGTWIP